MSFRWIVCLAGLLLTSCGEKPAREAPYEVLEWKDDVYHFEGQPFTGVALARYDDGARKGEYPFVGGKFHGVVREYWPNGQQSVETHFEEGQRHGSNRYWNLEGKLTKEQVYERDHSVSVKKFD